MINNYKGVEPCFWYRFQALTMGFFKVVNLSFDGVLKTPSFDKGGGLNLPPLMGLWVWSRREFFSKMINKKNLGRFNHPPPPSKLRLMRYIWI